MVVSNFNDTLVLLSILKPFYLRYQTENGITAQELGKQRGSGPDAVLEVQGDYSYTSPEGKQIVMSYVADDSGFHPSGDLPTPPPIPLAIQKSLAWNAAHPEEDREDLVVRIGQQRRFTF